MFYSQQFLLRKWESIGRGADEAGTVFLPLAMETLVAGMTGCVTGQEVGICPGQDGSEAI